MKAMNYVLSLFASLLIAGCSTPFRPWNLSEIEEGMSRDQVEQVLGQPDYIEVKDGAEYLHYTYQEDYNPSLSPEMIYEDNDRAFQELNTLRAFRKYEYVVILVDGRVINYKEL